MAQHSLMNAEGLAIEGYDTDPGSKSCCNEELQRVQHHQTKERSMQLHAAKGIYHSGAAMAQHKVITAEGLATGGLLKHSAVTATMRRCRDRLRRMTHCGRAIQSLWGGLVSCDLHCALGDSSRVRERQLHCGCGVRHIDEQREGCIATDCCSRP